MILSPRERIDINSTYEIVANVCLSLEYQLKKVLSVCEKIEIELDKPRDTWYINSLEFAYNNDFLINSFSILLEYYHTWVIQNLIGITNPNIKISYKAIEDGDNDLVEKILKKYEVGKTNRPDLYDFDFYDKCKSKYLSAMRFLFVGRYHEVFVLNNYIKHNHMMSGYEPLSILKYESFSFPYLHIGNRGNLLNRSLLRYLWNYSSGDLIDSIDYKYYKNYVINSSRESYSIGGLDIIVINGLEYVKSANSIGLSIESLLETVKLVSVDILNVMIEGLTSDGITGGTNMDNFLALKSSFKARKAKTIRNALESKS